MRRLQPRNIVPLPDLAWITSEQYRLALGFSKHWWKHHELPVILEYFPPEVYGPDPIADRRWRLDDIVARIPSLGTHLAPGTWLDRFRQRQRTDRDATYASTAKQVAA